MSANVVSVSPVATDMEKSSPVESSEEAAVPATATADQTSLPVHVVLAISALMGFIFGFCFEKSRVFEPVVIRGQFVFERWIMLKM
jgi:hypothetical protein